jgi:hypothetical protein
VSEPSVVCTLLKAQLRSEELPASAEDSRTLSDILERPHTHASARVDAIVDALDHMSSIRTDTLEALVRMFKLIITETKSNLMSVENLGLSVGE